MALVRRIQTCLVLVCIAAVAASPARADQKSIEGWWRAEWSKARNVASAHPVYTMSWETQTIIHAKDSELAELQGEVSGKPDHPKRSELEKLLRQRAAGPDRARHRLWWESSGSWRYAMDVDYLDTYIDSAQNTTGRWILGPTQLTTIPLEGSPGYEHSATAQDFSAGLRVLLYGGMGQFEWLVVSTVSVSGNDFQVEMSDPSGTYAERYSGTWDPAIGRGFVRMKTVTRNTGDSTSVGETLAYENWTQHTSVGLWSAMVAERRSATGDLNAIWKLTTLEPSTSEAVRAHAATPGLSDPDLVRGVPTFTRIFDVAQLNTFSTGSQPPVPLPGNEALTENSARTLQVLAGVSAGCVVLSLVWLRVRRPRSRTHGEMK